MNHFADTQLALFVFNCVNCVKIILQTIYVKIMSLTYILSNTFTPVNMFLMSSFFSLVQYYIHV